MKAVMNALQPLARALMLPIAVLPIAGLLLRLGQPDLLDIAFISAAGDAIFSHLGLLFAIGVATGFSRDGNGAACLAGVICFLVARGGAQVLMTVPPEVTAGVAKEVGETLAAAWKEKAIARLDVPIGIISGLAGGLLYNRFATIALPQYLAFFGGRRFVPIIAGLFGVVLAALVGSLYPWISAGVDAMSLAISHAGLVGLFLFGLLNRLLLITGLHHLLNNIIWFVAGDFNGTTGELRRFFAGDPSAGGFMAGFFPVMMFGLPAACLAIYHTALPERRKAVGGMMISLALTSLLTGVTEPIEFLFIFLAPALYGLHAVLTGVAMVVMALLGVKLAFGFSAGLIDYLLNFNLATRPLLLLPVGLAYAAIYYAMFRYAIVRFDLKTPGREPEAATPSASTGADGGDARGPAFLAALGGAANLPTISACTTRLRLVLRDPALVDEAALRSLGALGIIRPSANALQVVLGPIADQVAEEMRAASARPDSKAGAVPEQTVARPASLPDAIAAALGGHGNIREVASFPNRFRVSLANPALANVSQLTEAGVRRVGMIDGRLHILIEGCAKSAS